MKIVKFHYQNILDEEQLKYINIFSQDINEYFLHWHFQILNIVGI